MISWLINGSHFSLVLCWQREEKYQVKQLTTPVQPPPPPPPWCEILKCLPNCGRGRRLLRRKLRDHESWAGLGSALSTISLSLSLSYNSFLHSVYIAVASWDLTVSTSSTSKLCSVTFGSLKMFLPQPSETCQNCNYKVVKFRWQTLKEISKLLHNLIST